MAANSINLAFGAGALFSESKGLRVDISPVIQSTDEIVREIEKRTGRIEAFFWYEGQRGVPKMGASFMRDQLFAPLYRTVGDLRLNLCSIKGWDFSKTASAQKETSLVAYVSEEVNNIAVKCLSAADFFQFCAKKEGALKDYLSRVLPGKEWLMKVSEMRADKGINVKKFFDDLPSLFDSIAEMDVQKAYSCMQYVEGYYLVAKAVSRALESKLDKLTIAFLLPNNEGEYYRDFPTDIPLLLKEEFGDELEGLDIEVCFYFFKYGEELLDRPYIQKMGRRSDFITKSTIKDYWNFLEDKKEEK